jgi:ketosteroid isomerase-like protein
MGQGEPADRGRSNLKLARALIPPGGNNWGEIAHSRAVERDFRERIRPLLHEDFETVFRQDGEEERLSLEPMMAALRQIGGAFESLVAVPELFVELDERVLVLVRREGRTVNGQDFSEPGAAIYTFEDGSLRLMELYADRSRALAATGLTEADANERGVRSDELD